ncbi:MAG: hypothetical protein IPQ13_12090 [Holophagaceae bacterium]|nr:hypothetical protein [Holophagaceae bacterium]
MKRCIHVALLATLVSAAGWSQDVNVYSTTMAQLWKQETPGFDKYTYTPVTQYLGIDATKLGTDALSLHIYGWGMTDLADQSSPNGKSGGYLTSGYLQYRFSQANAEIKAGRFMVSQGGGMEHVDGVSARADLRGGFAISAFGGRPVRFASFLDPDAKQDYDFQHDVIFGTRLSLRIPKAGEIGLSYLQDGSTAAKDLPIPSPVDYSRKQLGIDFKLSPHSAVDFSGRTLFDLASHADTPATLAEKPSKIAEHDYTLSVKVADSVSVAGTFTERNFYAYFAGSNLKSLFRQDEKDKFRSFGGSVAWGSPSSIEVVADFRNTHRESYGDANRFGADVRWNVSKWKLLSGFGYHRVDADDAPLTGTHVPTYGLSHQELRAWAMYQKGLLSASLDGIFYSFNDKTNPNLGGKGSIYQVVGSVGYQTTANLKISGDISYGDDALFKKQVMGLLRVEYRFASAGKGGRK